MIDDTTVPVRAAVARIRRFLELWDSAEDILGFTEEFRLDPADLTTALDVLDEYISRPAQIITLLVPGGITEEQAADFRAKWIAAHGRPHRVTSG